MAQIFEAFLFARSEGYKKQGSKFVKQALARLITKDSISYTRGRYITCKGSWRRLNVF